MERRLPDRVWDWSSCSISISQYVHRPPTAHAQTICKFHTKFNLKKYIWKVLIWLAGCSTVFTEEQGFVYRWLRYTSEKETVVTSFSQQVTFLELWLKLWKCYKHMLLTECSLKMIRSLITYSKSYCFILCYVMLINNDLIVRIGHCTNVLLLLLVSECSGNISKYVPIIFPKWCNGMFP